MTDRKGFAYETLLQVQREHLQNWGTKLQGDLFEDVGCYVLAQNRCATQPDECHRVYRGQDLIEIIRQWPDLQSPYEKPTAAPTIDDV